MIIVGLGSSGLRVLDFILQIIKESCIEILIGDLHIVGFDTNETVAKEIEESLGRNGEFPFLVDKKIWPIGLRAEDAQNALKEIPNTGGVVATVSGAGNRRKLGEISYKKSTKYEEIKSYFEKLFGNSHEVIVVGSLAGGTASGVFPIFGEDLKNWGGRNLSALWAIALIPGTNHESSVRKANSLAGLYDINFQGIWDKIFLLSTQGSKDGGKRYITGGEDEQEAYWALLEFTAIFTIALLLNTPLSDIKINKGIYTIKPNIRIVLDRSIRRSKAVDILVDALKNAFKETHDEPGYDSKEKFSSVFFEKLNNYGIQAGKLEDNAIKFLKGFFEMNFVEATEDNLLGQTDGWWDYFSKFVEYLQKELNRNKKEVWFDGKNRKDIEWELNKWAESESLKNLPLLGEKIKRRRYRITQNIKNSLKRHEFGEAVYEKFKKWKDRWFEPINKKEELKNIIINNLRYSLRFENMSLHNLLGVEKVDNVRFSSTPEVSVNSIQKINIDVLDNLDKIETNEDRIKLWNDWAKRKINDFMDKIEFRVPEKSDSKSDGIIYIEMSSVPSSVNTLSLEQKFLKGSLELYPVNLSQISLKRDDDVKKELVALNTFNALRYIVTDSQLHYLRDTLKEWWGEIANYSDDGTISKGVRPYYSRILVPKVVSEGKRGFSPFNVREVVFSVVLTDDLHIPLHSVAELWRWIEDYLKPSLRKHSEAEIDGSQKAKEILNKLGG